MPVRIDDWPDTIEDAQDLDEIAMRHQQTFGSFEALETEVRFWRAVCGVLVGFILLVGLWWVFG